MRHILIKSTFALALGIAPGLAMAQTELPRHNAPDQSQGRGGGQQGGAMQGDQGGGQMQERGGEMRGGHGMQRGGQQDQQSQQGGARQGDQGGGQMQERGGEMRGGHGMQRGGQEGEQGKTGHRAEERGGGMRGQHAMRPMDEKQRTEVRRIFREEHIAPERDINFSVDVGAHVPREVHLHHLPPRIVEIVPEYVGDEYFVLPDGRIAIVEPDALEVIAIVG